MNTRRLSSASRQSGMSLIEVLIAMLIFLLGIVGLLGVGNLAVAAQSSAEYRTEAAQLANEMAQQIWIGVDRSTGSATALRTSLLAYAHRTTGSAASCDYTGDESSNAQVTAWKAKVLDTRGMPGATEVMQQILVNTSSATNQVTINLCWQAPNDSAPRRHSLITVVN